VALRAAFAVALDWQTGSLIVGADHTDLLARQHKQKTSAERYFRGFPVNVAQGLRA